MPVTEVTGYIETSDGSEPFALTLTKNNESGYMLLKPLLPLLKQLDAGLSAVDVSQLRNDSDTVEHGTFGTDVHDPLLSKFGILVDTDEAGNKWITEEKAFELLEGLGIAGMYRGKFDASAQTPGDQSGSGSPSVLSHVSLSHHDNAGHIKRSTHDDDAEAGIDSHRELGSPLKKTKLDGSISAELLGNGTSAGLAETKPLPVFSHDLFGDFLAVPLQLHKAAVPDSNTDNNQRMKLETFLQKLLFPDNQQDGSETKGNENATVPDFHNLLAEVENAFPDIELNLNIPVDEHGNTPLHWLTSIANVDLVKELVRNGSNRLIGDNMGESALVKAVKSVNNYDSGTFEELLDYLYPCLILEDSMNRTILHHIIITSGMTGCSSAAKYYLDIMMGWIVKQPSRELVNGDKRDAILENLTLNWVISSMLNAQDSNGDTCLNIAARLGNVSIVDALLDYGADPHIPNKSGLRPVDFGAGTSKLNGGDKSQHGASADTSDIKDEDMLSTDDNRSMMNGLRNIKKPDTDSLVNDIKSLLSAVSKDYEIEVNQHNEKLEKLRKDLTEERQKLSTSREELSKAKQVRDQYNLLKEQLKNINDGIESEENAFREESKKLGISVEDTAGIDWDSNDFDADEPFRVDFIYGLMEDKLHREYDGDMDKFLAETDVDSLVKDIQDNYDNSEDKINDMLPPVVLLNARINAYKRNDLHLENNLNAIKEKQSKLELKFRRVLSLCLKIEEDKVDGMLDGLLQAISSEDPQDIDTDEMQDFLKKHAV